MSRDEDTQSISSRTYEDGTPVKRDYLFKILVIGELGTGKTSIIKRFVHQHFSQLYRATIGLNFASKDLVWDENTSIRVHLWDIGGEERVRNMTRVFYKESQGAIIVFDVTRNATLDGAIKWKQDLDSKVQLIDGSPIPCFLLANKCDQKKQGIANIPAKMDEFVKKNGFTGWFETSAMENINVEEAINALITKILLNVNEITAEKAFDSDLITLEETPLPEIKKKCPC